VAEDATERTGGALFVEELTRHLVERGEQATLRAIPPTLDTFMVSRTLPSLPFSGRMESKGGLGGLVYVLTAISHFAELSANRGSFRAGGFGATSLSDMHAVRACHRHFRFHPGALLHRSGCIRVSSLAGVSCCRTTISPSRNS
jgi:hypothetical protein